MKPFKNNISLFLNTILNSSICYYLLVLSARSHNLLMITSLEVYIPIKDE